MLPLRIKTTDVATVRERQRLAQGNRCAICQLPMTAAEACLDHCHSTSNVRGTLHRGCNALLGKVENNAARYGVRNIAAFANGIAAYLQLHSTNLVGKKFLRNKPKLIWTNHLSGGVHCEIYNIFY